MSALSDNLLLGAPAAAAGGISRSLRFNSSDSAYCGRSFSSAGNRKTWTWSAWVKRSRTGVTNTEVLFQGGPGAGGSDSNYYLIRFDGSDRLDASSWNGAAKKLTTQVFRDLSAWYHIVFAFDSTQSTAANRQRFYVNGIEVTTFTTDSTPTQNTDYGINAAVAHNIGREEYTGGTSNAHFSGYLAEIHFIDGQALTPSSFAETDATTGQWIPKLYSGSYGTNGFKLTFADNSAATAAALGKDSSGNSPANNWTPTNFSVLSGGPFSVAAASGALPIYNTTDTYGGVKGTGTRTDSNSSSIILAVPMNGTNGGTTFTDESATIKGSGSAKTITVNSATTSTAQSKYYGSSGSFDGSSSNLSIASSSSFAFTGDFTWEAWIYPTTNSVGAHSRVFEFSDTLWALYIYPASNNYAVYAQIGSQYVFANNAYKENQWTHLAIVKSGSTVSLYSNGTLLASAVNSQTVAGPLSLTINGNSGGSYRWPGYIQDLRMYTSAKYTSNFNPPSSTQNTTVAPGCDSTVDTPTSVSATDTGIGGEIRGNYCTWNSAAPYSGSFLSNGNLDFANTSGTHRSAIGTIGVSSGKWYWEMSNVTDGNVGISSDASSTSTYVGDTAGSWGFTYLGTRYNSGSGTSGYPTFSNTDVIGLALNLDAGTLTLYKNGVSQGTAVSGLTGTWFPATGRTGQSSSSANFGQRAFAYTAPSGFKALCDTNLTAPVIAKSASAFDVKLYTGNGSTQTISGLGFSPDLVWLKVRSAAVGHGLFDQVRGAGKALYSHATNAEYDYGTTSSGELYQFNSDGFNLGSFGVWNVSSQTSVAWCWDAGSSTVSNTQGSITSSVRANATAGMSIVGAPISSSGGSIGHGLNVSPGLIIVKNRGTSGTNWVAWHSSLGTNDYLLLNSTDAKATGANLFNAVSSSTFTVGSGFAASTLDFICYCFAPVVGYSSFGSYTGNGSSDGPFVFTGMRPRFLMIKRTDSTGSWYIMDTARDTYNYANLHLYPNASSAEAASSHYTDILSNGFKARGSATDLNGSGGTYIYAAFAESPFNYARAR